MRSLSERMGALCEELNVPFLPAFDVAASSPAWRRDAERGDGVHPNRDGYDLLYNAVHAWRAWRDWVP